MGTTKTPKDFIPGLQEQLDLIKRDLCIIQESEIEISASKLMNLMWDLTFGLNKLTILVEDFRINKLKGKIWKN